MSMHKSQPYYVKTNNMSTQKRINTMIYYLFPHSHVKISSDVSVITGDYCPTVSCSYSLYSYLSEMLDVAENEPSWKQKYNALYSYDSLPSISRINISSIHSYEIIEIYHIMNFFWEKYPVIASLHFSDSMYTIDALQYIRKNHDNDIYYHVGNNLEHSIEQLHIFSQYKARIIFYEAHLKKEYENAIDLLLQLCIGFQCQTKKGGCIIKYGDTFSILSLQILILLDYFYEKVYILKPSICKVTSSEKYIVCKNFRYDKLEVETVNVIASLYKSILQCPKDEYVQTILKNTISLFISSRFEEINSIFCQPRLEHLYNLISNHEKILSEYSRSTNREKCIEWCKKHLIFDEKDEFEENSIPEI